MKLFDLPLYSSDSDRTVGTLSYESDVLDFDGYHHKECYMLCTTNSENKSRFLRYELNNNYNTLKGNIYYHEGERGTAWIEFYDGDEFLYSTAKRNDSKTSAEFEVDISGVNYLTVYAVTNGTGYTKTSWIITDQITLTK